MARYRRSRSSRVSPRRSRSRRSFSRVRRRTSYSGRRRSSTNVVRLVVEAGAPRTSGLLPTGQFATVATPKKAMF